MSIALDLARLGLGRTSPNPAVGCLIVKEGKILATGFHKQAGLPHAEAEALKKIDSPQAAGRAELQGATLYVNLEPCCHQGRTPPCTDAILRSGIKTVVVGMQDPDPKVRGRGIRILKKSGITVRLGVLESECRRLNAEYLTHREKGRPLILLKMATTLQGVVGWKGRGAITSRLQVTGLKAQRRAHEYRDQADAILVGINTVLADDPRLTTRLPGGVGKDPVRIVLDHSLRIPLTAKIFHLKSSAPTWIVTSTKAKRAKREAIKRLGGEVLYCPSNRNGGLNLRTLLKKIAERQILSVLIEGGPQVWASFLREKLVDQLLLFIGLKRGAPLSTRQVVSAPFDLLQLPFQEIRAETVGEDLLIQGALSPPN